MNTFFQKLQSFIRQSSLTITVESWLATFLGIVFIRIFLEQFAYFVPNHFLVLDLPTIVHYIVFFLAVRLSILLLLTTIGQLPLKEAATLSIFGLLTMWLGPLIDLSVSGIGGSVIGYPLWTIHDIFLNFFTFLGFRIDQGVTLGVRIGLALMFTGLFSYVKWSGKSIKRALGVAFGAYVVVFVMACIPSFINLVVVGQAASQNLHTVISVSQIVRNSLHPAFSVNQQTLFEIGFNKLMTMFSLIVSLIAGFCLFFNQWRIKTVALFKNSRFILFQYLLLLTLGLALYNVVFLLHWLNALLFLMLLIAFAAAWLYAVCQNDIADEVIDHVSNSGRPLIAGTLSHRELQVASHVFLLISIIASYTAGLYPFFCTVFSILLSHIYSISPLRLKRFPVLAGAIIGLASLSAVLAGFFVASYNQSIRAFPPTLALAVFVSFSIISNLKDIKDVDGDAVAGITTLPMLVGMRNFKICMALFLCFFYFAAAFYFSPSFLLIPAAAASILSWRFIVSQNYQPKKRIIVFLAYLVLIIVLLSFRTV